MKKENIGLYLFSLFFIVYPQYGESRGLNVDPGMIINVCLGGCLGVFPCPLYTWLCYYIRATRVLLNIFGLAGSQSTVSISRTRTRTMRTVSLWRWFCFNPIGGQGWETGLSSPTFHPCSCFVFYSSFSFFFFLFSSSLFFFMHVTGGSQANRGIGLCAVRLNKSSDQWKILLLIITGGSFSFSWVWREDTLEVGSCYFFYCYFFLSFLEMNPEVSSMEARWVICLGWPSLQRGVLVSPDH